MFVASRRRRRPPTGRRGVALLLVLIITAALGALALSAIYMAGNAAILSRTADRDADLRATAEASLQLVKSYLSTDAAALPDTGYQEFVLPGNQLTDAQGNALDQSTVRIWYGPTGTPTSTGATFADIIAEVTDSRGGRTVRRLQVTRESFAKFAYFSDRESSSGGTIYFFPGDVLFGPVWSNDQISILSGSPAAEFRDSVWTVASSISGADRANFAFGYRTNQRRINLPSTRTVSRLRGLAAAGRMAFNAPTSGDESTARMRIEFVGVDLNGDGDETDRDEGFIRVFTANASSGARWLRADPPASSPATLNNWTNCGDWHTVPGGERRFFPVAVHNDAWFVPMITAYRADSGAAAAAETSVQAILSRAGARCFLGGDPHLAAMERSGVLAQIGGTDTTFTPNGALGAWAVYGGTIDPRLTALGRPDAAYLFPLSRDVNPGSRGVIDVVGTVGISGRITGRATLHSTANVVYLDDLDYAVPPGGADCLDILGIVADNNVAVGDNTIFTPQDINTGSGTLWRSLDDTPDAWLNAVIMTLNTSFYAENWTTGPTNALTCNGSAKGRGCLNLVGGLIQQARGIVTVGSGGGATGYGKRYSYDRCAATNPPPYFPTTGRFLDNYYYEIDPVGFDPATVFRALSPG